MNLTDKEKVTLMIALEDRIQKCSSEIELDTNGDKEFWARNWKDAHDVYNKIVETAGSS